MSELAVRDPALLDNQTLPAAVVPSAVTDAQPVATPPDTTSGVASTTKPAPDAANVLFDNYADGPGKPITGLPEARKVKTSTVTSDRTAMNDEIAKSSDLSKAELPTARRTAGDIVDQAGVGGVTNLNQVAYIMATARRESHMGNWMNEFGGNAYFEKHYGSRTPKGHELGNTGKTDGADFHGRGLVQITGRTNYTKWSNRLAHEGVEQDGQPIDMVNNPEAAADPEVAARIAIEGMRDGGFTKYKLNDFINDKGTDYKHARRIINGMNEADEIATQAQRYQGILEKHSGPFTDAIQTAQMKNLPTAHTGDLTAPSLTQQMLDPTRMTSGTSRFDSPHKMLRGNLGRFTPAAAPEKLTTLKTHTVQ